MPLQHRHYHSVKVTSKKAAGIDSRKSFDEDRPNALNKLEATKFKVELQLKNLKILEEQDSLMKGQNRQQTIQTKNRLQRGLDRSLKQLRQDLVTSKALVD